MQGLVAGVAFELLARPRNVQLHSVSGWPKAGPKWCPRWRPNWPSGSDQCWPNTRPGSRGASKVHQALLSGQHSS